MSKIRFGFIGAGQIAHNSAKQVNNHPSAEVITAHDLSSERLRELCEQQNIPNQAATAQEVFANDQVDAVYIAVPNKFHAPLALEALEAGKHVILDKPFATTYADAVEVVETANRVGKVATLGMNQRFTKESQISRAVVERGDLGEIYHAKAWWLRRSGIPKLGTWFGNKELAGAGCLFDIGVHLLDLCLYTMGNFRPVSVSGATYTKFGNRGLGEGSWGLSDREEIQFDVDDFASAIIRMENGATVTLDVAWACHTEHGSMTDVRLLGTEAGMLVKEAKKFVRSPESGEYQTIIEEDLPVAFPDQTRFDNFINHLLGTEPLCTTMEQALAVQQILDGIQESSVTGREVLLGNSAVASTV